MCMKRLLLLLMFFLFAACGSNEPPTPTPEGVTNELQEIEATQMPASDSSAYPSPNVEPSGAYPPPNNTVDPNLPYPPPTRFIDESKRFTFDEPLKVNQEEISGHGPGNIPIKIISFSQGGESLGFGATSSDGEFEIALSRPLMVQEVIAIQLGDNSLLREFQDAPGTDIPMVGLVLVQSVVQP